MTHLEFPRVSGTNIRIQTIAIAAQHWKWSVAQIADEYDLTESQVQGALEFYTANCSTIDEAIAAEQAAEEKREATVHV
jgi:uncharacterized protein (DUF433 family)